MRKFSCPLPILPLYSLLLLRKMLLPSFSDIPTLYEAQDEVLCGDMDRARRVTSIATCGAAHSAEAEEESLKRSAELVSCMV